MALRILSVEDNPFGRVVLNAILNELGHQTDFIGRGENAPERLAQGDFDVVLMDMVLPGINGVEAIRRIRALERAARQRSPSSASRAATRTRRRRSPPAPTPFPEACLLRACWRRCWRGRRGVLGFGQPRLHDRGVEFAAVHEDRRR